MNASTMGDALRTWLRVYGPTISPGFEETARCLIRRHIEPVLGGRKLGALARSDALELISALSTKGLSKSTITGTCSVVRRVINLEIEAGRLSRNPFTKLGPLLRGVDRRNGRALAAIDAYELSELSTILAVARRDRPWLYPLLVFLAFTGCRRGEALGLRWGDVDLERRVVRIRRALVRGRETTPKSGRARVVPLDAGGSLVLEVLAELREGTTLDPAARVFRAACGGELDERNVTRAWHAVRTEAATLGVRPRRLHDLRHTFASHALESGVSVLRVAAWLGHANPEMTWRVYAHLVDARGEDFQRGFLGSVR